MSRLGHPAWGPAASILQPRTDARLKRFGRIIRETAAVFDSFGNWTTLGYNNGNYRCPGKCPMFHELAQGWRIESDTHGNWHIMRLHPPGEMFVESPTQADEIWGLINRCGTTLVVLDMEYVWLLPSSLMGVLVRIHKRLAQAGGTLHLCCLNAPCREALQVCHLDRVLPTYADRESAIRGGLGADISA